VSPRWLTHTPDEPLWVLLMLMALAGLALVAYAMRALDATGSAASFLLGLFVGLRGGLGWLLLLVTFTVIGVIVTRLGRARKEALRVAEDNEGERGYRNVIGNGAAAALAAAGLFLVPDWLPRQAVVAAFVTAVAAVTADTMASEIGTLARSARRILPPFESMRPGANGGISWQGQIAGLAGATLIAILGVRLVGLPASWAWLPALAGFLGCQLDSLLGATLERDARHDRPLSKQDVNFLASAVPALVVLVALSL
jgi:uncharacterized protein (TIGR00297 family)